jgi:hypothetical protein
MIITYAHNIPNHSVIVIAHNPNDPIHVIRYHRAFVLGQPIRTEGRGCEPFLADNVTPSSPLHLPIHHEVKPGCAFVGADGDEIRPRLVILVPHRRMKRRW